ncbi:MAG: hypothetical protein HY779_05535 [Rubrobacteridae bacterium]|nr:hypothetical protein [Rubrobacteridae bacterium]
MAAGLGERLAPLTLLKPKALMPVANRPVICRILDLLQRHPDKNSDLHNMRELFISLHKFPDAVKDVVGSGSAWCTHVH